MFRRIFSPEKLQIMPQDYTAPLENIFRAHFLKETSEENLTFKIYAFLSLEEILIGVNLLKNANEETLSSLSYFASKDFSHAKAKGKEIKENLDFLIETAIAFFEHYFSLSSEEQSEIIFDQFFKLTHKDKEYYYKFNRDNISLTLKAEELLGTI